MPKKSIKYTSIDRKIGRLEGVIYTMIVVALIVAASKIFDI